jgi:Protein of unknown function (DUF1622)
MGFEQAMDAIARGVEVLGDRDARRGLGSSPSPCWARPAGRPGCGGGLPDRPNRLWASILLGLEFLVAADIIRTVAVQPSLRTSVSSG